VPIVNGVLSDAAITPTTVLPLGMWLYISVRN
jgi:hypothetical protein